MYKQIKKEEQRKEHLWRKRITDDKAMSDQRKAESAAVYSSSFKLKKNIT